MRPPTVIFQITAIGKNVRALSESARSVLHWVRHTPRLGFRYQLWIVVEPEGHATDRAAYDTLADEGARLFVVPPSYTTSMGARGKARALEYATEQRRELGLAGPGVWVYHQDEETCVGQDTLTGLSAFVDDGRFLLGTGIILYPLDWGGQASQVHELTRSYDDFRVLDSMTMRGNPTTGFHGSHFVVRADVEDAVGWDSAGHSAAEDLVFEIRVRARYGNVFGILRGFGYEKGAFSVREQLRQRRRWVHGAMQVIGGATPVSWYRRLAVGYSSLSWFSALPSVIVLVASIWLRYGPLLEVTGVFTGFIWVSMVLAYIEGYRLHARYLPRRVGLAPLAAHGLLGALVDVIAPWYALVTRPSVGDFILKDAPAPGRASAPHGRPA